MPRLVKGETAIGIAARARRLEDGAARKCQLLKKILRQQPLNEKLAASFTSLEAIASLELASQRLMAMSPNTLRKHVRVNYEGGLDAFLADIAKIKKMLREKGDRQQDTSGVLRELREENQVLVKAIGHWSDRYQDLLKRMRKLADSSAFAKDILVAHQALFKATNAALKVAQ